MTTSDGRPTTCVYCDGTGRGPELIVGDGHTECGFCDKGVPLDTQEDWDRTWGRALKASTTFHD